MFHDDAGDPPCWAHLIEQRTDSLGDAELAGLVRSLADAVLVCDRDGTIRFWNGAATALLGWSAEEAVGQSLDLIIPPRFRARHWAGYRKVMQTGQTDYGRRLLEVPALHRDGRSLSIAFTITLLDDASGAAPRLVAAVVRDNTEQWECRNASQARDAIDTKKSPRPDYDARDGTRNARGGRPGKDGAGPGRDQRDSDTRDSEDRERAGRSRRRP